ncbi:MAG: hypothetical protein AABX89_02115 [Candidatus Thermoplasmatota archaeon]
MRWPTIVLLALSPLSFILGFVINADKAFQISTGIIGSFVFLTGALVLLGMEQLANEA